MSTLASCHKLRGIKPINSNKWKAPRINPNNYRQIYYQDLQSTTITFEWEQESNKKIVDLTSI